MIQKGKGQDSMHITSDTYLHETGGHETTLTVEKFDIDQVRWVQNKFVIPYDVDPHINRFKNLNIKPFETYRKDNCNLILNAGWVNLMNAIAGTTPTKFVNNTTGRIGLGTSATAVAYTDVALGAIGALTTANWEVINAVPTIGSGSGAGNGLILAATFPLNAANGVAIAEFGVDFGTAATLSAAAVGGFFSHGNASPGTKTSSQVWNVIVTYQWT
jgi:hypothetical protein